MSSSTPSFSSVAAPVVSATDIAQKPGPRLEGQPPPVPMHKQLAEMLLNSWSSPTCSDQSLNCRSLRQLLLLLLLPLHRPVVGGDSAARPSCSAPAARWYIQACRRTRRASWRRLCSRLLRTTTTSCSCQWSGGAAATGRGRRRWKPPRR
jgi:hypothetical protein